jgi:G:T/U-mismatch repair DNA glycosylase
VSTTVNRNNRTAAIMAMMGLLMLGLAFASVPLYRIFCQVTGYGGTTQRAEAAPGAQPAEGKIGVRFDANVSTTLPWKFEPVQERVQVVPGASTKILYRATNMVARPTPGVNDLSLAELRAGRAALEKKIKRYKPEIVAVVGITVYRALFPAAKAVKPGRTGETLGGAAVWVLPNPSGRNAHYSHQDRIDAFTALARALRHPRKRTS